MGNLRQSMTNDEWDNVGTTLTVDTLTVKINKFLIEMGINHNTIRVKKGHRFHDISLTTLLKEFDEWNRQTTKLIKVSNEWLPEIDVTECCKTGPITNEKYCPDCGAKIVR